MDKNKSKGKIDRKIENQTSSSGEMSKREEEKEKKMSKAQKAVPVLIVICVSLAVILLATLIAFFQLKKDDKQNASTLEAVYASSYFTMVDGINNLQVDSSKFETLPNEYSQRASLKNMEQDCMHVLSGLSILPIEAENCMSATKFFNQINGMCEAYINKLDRGEELTNEELALVTEMSYVLGTIKTQFNDHNTMVSKVGYSFIASSVFNSKGVNEFSTSLGSLKSDTIEYPTMIFDGPFSASLEEKEVKGLSKTEISQKEAEDYIKNNVFYGYDDVKIEYQGEVTGDFETYSFACKVNDIKYVAEITKREGKLLTLSGYAERREPVLSKENAIKLAETFATRLGFEDMKSVWLEKNDNIAYVNLAPVINNVIYYPDLVKVKIDLGGQVILGFESQNYCFNHIDRNIKVGITEKSAKEMIVGDFEILDTSLALIPLENESEILTYEIKCEGLDGTYYFYINAENKKIEQTLKVVEQGGSNKLI